MVQVHTLMKGTLRVGKKGVITLPKKIREEDGIKEHDILEYTHTPSGDIVLKRKNVEKKDGLLDFLKTQPKFDWRQAWEEIREERKREW